tara:strand:+ start:444 stop:836 length:393 start_codon:yes stop_codon:yes gene_type:complete
MAQKKKTSKKTAKASKKTKKPLESLSQTHGKEEKYQPTTLDQIWGDKGNTKYGTTDVNDYIKQLDAMNTSDLQTHAHKMGLIPVDDRVTITKKLIYEFKRYISGYRKPDIVPPKNSEPSSELKKILGEGR